MAVVEVFTYNGPAMSPWQPPDQRRPSNPRDDTISVVVPGAGVWSRSIRPGWMSDWHRYSPKVERTMRRYRAS